MGNQNELKKTQKSETKIRTIYLHVIFILT
jgi:hypothetical protein